MAHESDLSARSSGWSSDALVQFVHASVVHRDAAVDARHPATQRARWRAQRPLREGEAQGRGTLRAPP